MVERLVRTCKRSASRNSPLSSRRSLSSNMLRGSISIFPMTAPAASSSLSLGRPAGRGSSMRVCSLSVSFAASPGSVRDAARIVKAISRQPSDSVPAKPLQRGVIGLAGTDAQNAQDVGDEDFAVADLAGFRGADNGFHHLVDEFVFHGDFDT